MSTIIPEPVSKSEARLTELLLPLKGTPVFERVQLYVARFAGGRKLSEYLADKSVSRDAKDNLLDTLVAILDGNDLSRLPEIVAPAVVAKSATVEPPSALSSAMAGDAPAFSLTAAEVRAIAREEARAELADVLGKIGRVLGHPVEEEVE